MAKLLLIDCFNKKDSIDEFILFDTDEEKIYDCFEEQSIKNNNHIIQNPISRYNDENMYEDYITLYDEAETYIISDQQFKTFSYFTQSHVASLKYSSFLKQHSLEEWLI